ncbi:hypothetical protein MPER_02020, partial [Moniliophthora perniciosa FA553]
RYLWQKWLKTSRDEAKKLYDNRLQGETLEKNDVLGVLSRSLDAKESEKRLDTEEALSQMFTMIMVGHETSGITLTWLFYELARHPADQERLNKEIRQIREQKGSDLHLTANDYDSMPFLNAVIKVHFSVSPSSRFSKSPYAAS